MIQVKENSTHAIIEEYRSAKMEFFTSIAKNTDDRGLYQIFTSVPLKVKHADAYEKQIIEIEEQTYEILVKRIDLANGFLHLSIDKLENEDHFTIAFEYLLEITKNILHNQR